MNFEAWTVRHSRRIKDSQRHVRGRFLPRDIGRRSDARSFLQSGSKHSTTRSTAILTASRPRPGGTNGTAGACVDGSRRHTLLGRSALGALSSGLKALALEAGVCDLVNDHLTISDDFLWENMTHTTSTSNRREGPVVLLCCSAGYSWRY